MTVKGLSGEDLKVVRIYENRNALDAEFSHQLVSPQ
jgi:hypothetical protein